MTLISEREATARLHLHRSTLSRLRRLNQGPAWIRLGREVLYSEAALDSWVANCTRVPSTPEGEQKEGAVSHA